MFDFLKDSPEIRDKRRIRRYIRGGRVPWTKGYDPYKMEYVLNTLNDTKFTELFQKNLPLPDLFGERLDERAVEYPWVFARLRSSGLILDAGGTLNKKCLLDSRFLKDRSVIVYTLHDDTIEQRDNVSYMFHDLRKMLLIDNCVESIVCISTLEHIGSDYDCKRWNLHHPNPNFATGDYAPAMREMCRILKPGGQLLLTVPYGRYENHGWLQQFDAEQLQKVISSFPGKLKECSYFRYHPTGWQTATAEECKDLSYYNLHEGNPLDLDFAAAARSVACLEFYKPA